MKLLQVCNVAHIVGGTGACAWTITRALPDWQHEVFFFGRFPLPQDLTEAFAGCTLRKGTSVTREQMEGYDVVIFHNTPEYRMPGGFPEDTLRVYYQHSHSELCRGARQRCDIKVACSKYLADLAGLEESDVLLQPVPTPPFCSDTPAKNPDELRIGRFCTPNRDKWKPEDVLPFYSKLADLFPSVQWDFVGCPHSLQEKLTESCRGRAVHYDAGWSMRHVLWGWDALLYHSSLPETYGRTVCEAQRAGCIPIVDNAGGFREQITHREDGFLCSHPNEFAGAVRALLADPERKKQIAENASDNGTQRGSLALWRKRFLQRCSAVVADA